MTQRLAVRPWRPEDLASYQELSADPNVMAYLGDGKPRTSREAHHSFDRMQASWQTNGFGTLAIEHLDDASFLGLCGLAPVENLSDLDAEVEIGWRLKSEHWGNGYATEACAAVIDWAFSGDVNIELSQLFAIVQVSNRSSIRVAERLGMQRERRTIVPGHQRWVDVFQIDAPTWQDRQSS